MKMPWAKPEPPAPAPEPLAIRANPVTLITGVSVPDAARAAHRFHAIVTDREKRRLLGQRRGDHGALTGEAIEQIGVMVRCGHWTFAQAMDGMARLAELE